MSSVVIDAVVNIQAGQLNDFSKNLRKAAQDSINGIDYTRMERGFKSVGDKLNRLIADAVDHDLKFDFKGVYDLQKKYVATMKDGAAKVARYEAALKKDNLRREVREQIQARLKATQQVMKAEQEIIDKRLKAEKEIQDAAKEYVSIMKKGVGEVVKELGDGFDNAVSGFWDNLKSGNAKDIFKNLSSGSGKMGKSMGRWAAAQQGKTGGMGAMAKSAAKFGKVLVKIGAVVGVLAGVVAAFGMIVKVMLDANSQQKEFNRLILDGVGGAEMLGRTFRNDIGKSLENMTKWAVSFSFTSKTVAKDLLGIINAYQQAGFTAKEMVSNMENAASATQGYSVAAQHALTYSRLLGMTATETATQMTESMEDLNQTLEGVAKRFSNVTRFAMESGFGVKRFFSMVLQATSGMSMYNVRLEEAAGLLVRIGKILGSKVGGDFLAQLGKGFVDESMQDRMKRVMLTGKGRTQNAFELSARDTSRSFGGTVTDLVRSGGMDAKSMFKGTALEDFAKDGFADLNGTQAQREAAQGQLKKLTAGMTDQEMSDLLGRVRLNVGSLGNDGDAMVRGLENMLSVQRGSSGNFSDMVTNLDALDMGGTLNMLLGSGKQLFDGKELHELNAKQLAAIENSTNLSGEQLQQMREMSRAMHGNWETAKNIAAAQKEAAKAEDFKALGLETNTLNGANLSKADLDAIGRYMQDQQMSKNQANAVLGGDSASFNAFLTQAKDADRVRQVKAMGGFIDNDGLYRAATIGEDGSVEYDRNAKGIDPTKSESYQAYIQSQGDAMSDKMAHTQMSLDQSLQSEIADNTYDIKTILEQGTNWLLQGISTMVGGIWAAFDSSAANKVQTMEELDKLHRGFQAEAEGLRQEIRGKERAKRQARTPAEAEAIQAEIDDLKKQQEGKLVSAEMHREAQRQVRSNPALADGFDDSWMPWNPDYDPDKQRAAALKAAQEDPALLARLVDIAPETIGKDYHRAIAGQKNIREEVEERGQFRRSQIEGRERVMASRKDDHDTPHGYAFKSTEEWQKANPHKTTKDGWSYSATEPSAAQIAEGEAVPMSVAQDSYLYRNIMGNHVNEGRKPGNFDESPYAAAGMDIGTARDVLFRGTGMTGNTVGTDENWWDSFHMQDWGWMPSTATQLNPDAFDAQVKAISDELQSTTGENKAWSADADDFEDSDLKEIYSGIGGRWGYWSSENDDENSGFNLPDGYSSDTDGYIQKYSTNTVGFGEGITGDYIDTDTEDQMVAENRPAVDTAARNAYFASEALSTAQSREGQTGLGTFTNALGLNPETFKPEDYSKMTEDQQARSDDIAEGIQANVSAGTATLGNLLGLLTDDEKKHYEEGLVVDRRARNEHERFLSGDFVDALVKAGEESGSGPLTSSSSRGVMNSLATAFEGSTQWDQATTGRDEEDEKLTMKKLKDQLTSGNASSIDAKFIEWLNQRVGRSGKARWELYNIPEKLFEAGNTSLLSKLQDFIAVPGDDGTMQLFEPSPGDTYRMDESTGMVIGSKSGGPFSNLGVGGGNNGGRIIHEWRITSQQDADALYRTAMRLLALQQRRGS